MKTIRVAAVTLAPRPGQNQLNRERMRDYVLDAARHQAGLICFPELSISGCDPDQRTLGIEPVPGPSSDFLAELATRQQITILAGLAEQGTAGRIYISQLICLPNQNPAVYRKIHLGPPEKNFFTAGDDIPVFDNGSIRFGVQLCYDAHFPELATHIAGAGADLILIPHASPHGHPADKLTSWMRHLPARAYDNSVFIVACNLSGSQGRLQFPGVAVALGPDGYVLSRYIGGDEALLLVDLEAQALTAVRGHPMRYFLPHRRPEVYEAMSGNLRFQI